MDIKLPDSLLREYITTNATPEQISESLSLCGPTVDHLHQLKDDYVYDIEIITNRVDAASAFGVAREAAAILPHFNHSAELANNPYDLSPATLGSFPKTPPVTLQILDQSLISRLACLALEVELAPSPPQVQSQLESVNIRSINNVVDITNELTLRLGQPVHVFDLDKIASNKMILRESKKGEKISTLDNQIHTLKGGDIVIEDGEGRLIDLCGIMGGSLSEVDQSTKRVLLFLGTFEPKRIRRTSLYTQERTLASQIFEKKPDPELAFPTLIKGAQLLQERANAKIVSAILDIYPTTPKTKSINLDLNWLNRFIGINIPSTQTIKILTDLGFESKNVQDDQLSCLVPTWRLDDISTKEDLAEEIARVYGYFRLPSVLPPTVITSTQTDALLTWELTAKNFLATLGFTEIFNYSLVSEDLFKRSLLPLNALKLSNPLSADYEYLRTSLIPSLLQDLADNKGKTLPPLRIFELSNIYEIVQGQDLPNEIPHLALATQGEDYRTTKGYLEALAAKLGLSLGFQPLDHPQPPFIPAQSASIILNSHVVGTIGTITPQVLSNFDLSGTVIITHMNFASLASASTSTHHFKPIPTYQSIIEDLTIQSDQSISDLLNLLEKSHPLITQVTYKTSHQNKHTFTLEFNHPNRNLTQDEVNQIKTEIIQDLSKE